MKKVLSLLVLAGFADLTACGAEMSAALPCITYRGTLVDAASEAYPSDVGRHDRMMTFRVYDTDVQGADALWTSSKLRTTVNPDGSFEAKFGDETLAALITTGTVTHVGLQLGESSEITPRRALRPVVAATRAVVAEDGTPDMRIGTLSSPRVIAKSMSVSLAEISESLVVEAGKIRVEPFSLVEGESTRLLRGKGVKVFASGEPANLGMFENVSGGLYLVRAPADGVALVHSLKASRSGFMGVYAHNRVPGVIQFCRAGDEIKAPTDAACVRVSFWKFAK